MDDHHSVLLPPLAGPLVADAAPQVHDLLPVVPGTTGSAQFVAEREVIGERLAHRLETRTDVPVNTNGVGSSN
jgi:hypothetical protein